MSKVDAQRALRDARYAKFAANKSAEVVPRPARPAAASTKKRSGPDSSLVELFAVDPVPTAEPTLASSKAEAEAEPEVMAEVRVEPEPASVQVTAASREGAGAQELCGHRSINGRSCTRDKGHPQANHRYS